MDELAQELLQNPRRLHQLSAEEQELLNRAALSFHQSSSKRATDLSKTSSVVRAPTESSKDSETLSETDYESPPDDLIPNEMLVPFWFL